MSNIRREIVKTHRVEKHQVVMIDVGGDPDTGVYQIALMVAFEHPKTGEILRGETQLQMSGEERDQAMKNFDFDAAKRFFDYAKGSFMESVASEEGSSDGEEIPMPEGE